MNPDGVTPEEIDALFAQRAGEQEPTRTATFPSLERSGVEGIDPSAIGLLANVELEVAVRLGQTRMRIRDILGLGPGSVLELDRLAGEAVDILVNGHLVAKGEVVVIGENFGVRITELVDSLGGKTK